VLKCQQQRYEECRRCELGKHRRGKVVPGRGDTPASILFIGEAPGVSEDSVGLPFIGASGKLLDRMILEAYFNSSCDVLPTYYITNTVFCRPYVWDVNDDAYDETREPLPNEILACTENVVEIYWLVAPRVVIFLGRIAEKFYKREFPGSYEIIHPSAIVRQGGAGSMLYLQNVRTLTKIFNTLED
jgi:uracil-DNA glycosylase family 4